MKHPVSPAPLPSRLGIGTVQFGMPYGINNRRGKVPYPEILRVLESARKAGVTFIDSSRAYGTSEEELGRSLEEIGAPEDFCLCTKMDLPAGYRELPAEALLEAARRSLTESLRALRRERIDYYLLHDPDYQRCEGVWQFLLEERRKGTIGRLGVSIARGPEEANAMLSIPGVEAIQLPFNLFDRRWHAASIFTQAGRRGVSVFTRSAYLQGLLVMSAGEVARRLPAALSYRQRLDDYLGRRGFSPAELALRYVLSTPGIESTVVGVDGHDQFMQNLATAGCEPLDRETMSELDGLFGDVPESIVNPALW